MCVCVCVRACVRVCVCVCVVCLRQGYGLVSVLLSWQLPTGQQPSAHTELILECVCECVCVCV